MTRVNNPETVSSHIFRTALLGFVIREKDIDYGKCIKMGLIHDLAESVIGDLTPDQALKVDKHQLEADGVKKLCEDLPVDVADEFTTLWNEFEDGNTKEAKLVREFDKLEMIMQAREYEIDQPGVNLETFFASTADMFTFPCTKALDERIRATRSEHINDHLLQTDQKESGCKIEQKTE
ncbi:putative HD domain containing protein [Monocercomonoides exilis]|uniref:putative HD domain containing protein n=1 Tax=Monocercomonoides exilis TaxID=2049356 RepID=UPI00355A8A2F|nr:putative HD domain containing protein [Monocercomonoides exilis]|eukprot:MONOS_5889.1-p1 / transcript=MONOS_5889.1 / gene=MONOS_5889 / organism=Monocercomonoides_exilis_PA203 / gene_product=HD domain containing protein / transcript_product=HD domain containing protein / location=Mono_scaffold00177:67218-68043(-) / protein_length=178 / sequence_SO=supercontig / SO=protein_coding / is_pseudo=false